MSDERNDRFYVRGDAGYEVFKAFRAAHEKTAGHRLGGAWYDDERWNDIGKSDWGCVRGSR
jgi:hypothetical protein